MVIALFALSLVMMVGGVAAMVQGFPYVRLESGLAMVIGGATAASAGAVLLGIGVAVGQLRRIATLLAERRTGEPAIEPGLVTFRAPVFDEPPLVAEPQPSLAAGTAGLAGLTLGAAIFESGTRPGRRPVLEPALEPALAIPAVAPVAEEPPLPGLLPAVEPPEADLFATEETTATIHAPDDRAPEAHAPADPAPAVAAQESLALRPALEDALPEPEPERISEPEAGDARTILGQHSADGSTYTMYSDGTIETNGLIGKRTFRSLEELSRFKNDHQEDAA